MNNNKIRLQRFISSSIAVLLFAAIALGAALPAAASTAASFTADFAKTQTGRAADNLRSNMNKHSRAAFLWMPTAFL